MYLLRSVALLIAMVGLGACETAGNPKLKVAIPADCSRNAVATEDPIETAKRGDQALAVIAEYRAKLKLANRRIVAVRDCDRRVRERFSTGH